MMNAALMDRYLQRLGFSDRPAASWASLRKLVTAHLQTVPFENLDIVDGSPAPLTTAATLHKVVNRARGGFCYELNEAFGALLLDLGFELKRIEARVWLEQQQQFGPPYDHLALLVSLPEGDFLTDVGFGDNNRTPMRLPEDELEDLSGRYTLARISASIWRLSRVGRPLYELTVDAQPLTAFVPMHRYHQESPDSLFAKGLICTRATVDGRVTLSRDRLVLIEGARRTESVVADRERALQQYFGIA